MTELGRTEKRRGLPGGSKPAAAYSENGSIRMSWEGAEERISTCGH
jgi:hypothetical protein